METNVLNLYSEILRDAIELLSLDELPIYNLENEKKPEDFKLEWKLKLSSIQIPQKPVLTAKDMDRNFSCKLCPGKLTSIRGFFHKGTKPLLVLHYTGEYKKNAPGYAKSSPTRIFRTTEAEDVFDRLIQKVFGFSSKELFFQEYPACAFNHNTSTDAEWKQRIEFCESHVLNTIKENSIKGILVTGSAAVLKYGMEGALSLTGKIQKFSSYGIELPLMIVRSPEGILSLEKKSKGFENNKSSDDYKKARKEENEVKQNIVSYLYSFKNELGLT